MPHVPIPWDLTFALAKKEWKETEETAQVNSSLIKVLSRPRMLTVLFITHLMLWGANNKKKKLKRLYW